MSLIKVKFLAPVGMQSQESHFLLLTPPIHAHPYLTHWGFCWPPAPLILVDEKSWIPDAMDPAWHLGWRKRTITESSGAQYSPTRQTYQPNLSLHLAQARVVSGSAESLWHARWIKVGFQYHNIYGLTSRVLALTYFALSGILSSDPSSFWPADWLIFLFTALLQSSLLMFYIVSLAMTFAFLLTRVQVLFWPDILWLFWLKIWQRSSMSPGTLVPGVAS